ncbi:MAG: glycosyltransferase [Anaerolineales bacterium]
MNHYDMQSIVGLPGNELANSQDGFRLSVAQEKGKGQPVVSVVIPTLNEAKNLPLILPFLPLNWIDEVVMVDGHSTDGTIEVAQRILPSIKIVREEIKGKGAALRAGYRAAKGDILIVIDADGSHDPREIPRYITALIEGADFVKGSRFAPGGGTTDMPWYRKLGNGGFVFLTNVLFGVKFTDLCYGYHAFWRYCLDEIGVDDFNGFEIDTALYLQAIRMRLHIVDVPSFEGYRFYGQGKLRTIPDGYRVLGTIFKLWMKTTFEKKQKYPTRFRGKSHRGISGDVRVGNPYGDYQLPRYLELINGLLNSADKLQVIMQELLEEVLNNVSAENGSLILLDKNGGLADVGLVSQNGFSKPEADSWAKLLQHGLAGWVMQNGQPGLVQNTNEDSRWIRRAWDQQARTAFAVPLIVGGSVIGILTLTRPVTSQFTDGEVEILNRISVAPVEFQTARKDHV